MKAELMFAFESFFFLKKGKLVAFSRTVQLDYYSLYILSFIILRHKMTHSLYF